MAAFTIIGIPLVIPPSKPPKVIGVSEEALVFIPVNFIHHLTAKTGCCLEAITNFNALHRVNAHDCGSQLTIQLGVPADVASLSLQVTFVRNDF